MRDVTQMLVAAAKGDSEAHARLLARVYEDLRELAAAKMRHESPAHTLQPTALVHEVYLRLMANNSQRWENRAHFYAAAGEAMRRILVESARRRHQLKRGGGRTRVPLPEELPDVLETRGQVDAVAIDEALKKLRGFDPRMCDIVNLRCFVGLNVAETARALGLSARTINREWVVAKAWLARELALDGPAPAAGT